MVAVVLRQRPDRVQMIGQDYDGVDHEGMRRTYSAKCGSEQVYLINEQTRRSVS